MKQDFSKCGLNESACNSKRKWNHDKWNHVGVSVKNEMIWVLVKMILCGVLARVIVKVIKHVKLTDI